MQLSKEKKKPKEILLLTLSSSDARAS